MTATSHDLPKTKNLLIVTDDESIARPISLLLTHYEFGVRVVTTVADGIKSLAADPDLFILDLQSADDNGLDLLEKLRGAGKIAKMFILLGDTSPAMERKSRRLMPDGYFKKPFNYIEILEAVRKLTGERGRRDVFAA